jgi:DNA primase
MNKAHTAEELKQLVEPLRVYEEYIRLSHQGRRAKALCPFHKEKTPSFSVDMETGLFHCFGCHKGGDVLTFLQEAEGCSFPESLEILARMAGVEYEPRGRTARDAPDRKERLRKLLAAAQDFYRKALASAPATSEVRRYMERRGIARRTEDELLLGFAPSGGGLQAHLSRLGYTMAEAVEAGLLMDRGGGETSERFRNRLLFPILDPIGRTVGFGGRSLGADEPKYLNSPESPVFQKRDLLYGISWTKGAIKERGQAVLVEGYMDFLALYQAGVTHAVATLGTALAEGQARLMKRYAGEAVLNFDRDAAGLAAAKRAILVLMAHGLRVRVLALTEGKDPDEFLRARGPEAYIELLDRAEPFFDFLAEQAQRGAVLHSVEGDLKFLDEMAEYLRSVPDPLEREGYARELAGRLRLDPKKVMGRLKDAQRVVQGPSQATPPAPAPAVLPALQQTLVRGLEKFPELAGEISGIIPREDLLRLPAGSLLASLMEGRGAEGPDQTVALAYIRNSCHDAPTREDTLAAARGLFGEVLGRCEQDIQRQIREASRKNDFGLIAILNREKMAVVRRRQSLTRG